MPRLPETHPRRQLALTFARFVPAMIRGAQLDFFASRSITQSQMIVLLSCFAHGRCPMSVLARDMHVTLPTMTGLVDRLVKAGYLRRLSSDQDRRQVLIEPTEKGRQFALDHRQMVANRFMEVGSQLTENDVQQMQRLLTKLLTQFGGPRQP
jgi:DNA-binding MarR family transcriptional regulator